ncbi:MAG: DUF3899 domain-containing protein [Firmicutes bacterium]|nr:DUF3899 domain-containing protein [Candidatus Colivicinus equi]
MKFKNIKVKDLIIHLILVFAYPIIKGIVSDNHLLAFSDSCTLISMFLLVAGILNALYLKGDFDMTGFIVNRSFLKNQEELDSYLRKQKEKREDGFNYPLLCAILLFIIGYITSLFV